MKTYENTIHPAGMADMAVGRVKLEEDDIDREVVGEYCCVMPGAAVAVYCLTLRNGYSVTGSSPASCGGIFDRELAQKLARQSAKDAARAVIRR